MVKVQNESVEELEPLFDYTRVQPVEIFCSDDEDAAPFSMIPCKKRRINCDLENEKENSSPMAVPLAVNCNDKENKEEDWMPPPPAFVCKSGSGDKEDKILQEIRLRKQELASFAQSTEDILKTMMESAKKKIANAEKPAIVVLDVDEPPKPPRQKILISIQEKDAQKKFCMYMDDKLEKLFKMYADKAQLNSEILVFCFDGDKLNPSATPASLGLENDDIIEVHKVN